MEVLKKSPLYGLREHMEFPSSELLYLGSCSTSSKSQNPVETSQSGDEERRKTACMRSLLVWGCGEFGQHGHNQKDDMTLEDSLNEMRSGRLLLGGEFPTVTSSGSSHALVLSDNGNLYSWGNGTSGQLGHGTCQTVHKPTPVPLKAGTQIQGMACGARHSFFWTTDGCCYSFGNNFSAQLGYNFSKADFKENQLEPVLVELFPGIMVREVACGARHTLFLLTTGHVMAVGCNQQGQIGNGTTDDAVMPTKLEDLSGILHIACGNSHSLASDETGQLYAWGYGKAFGTKTRHVVSPQSFKPRQNNSSPIAFLSGGDSHSMVLYENGVLFTWGNNYEGQLGLGNSTKYQVEPEPVPEKVLPRPVVQISCGETTCAAVTGEGKLYMWGKNAGVIHSDKPSQYFQFEPYHIEIEDKTVKQVSCGAWHVSAIVENIDELHRSTKSSQKSTKEDEQEIYIQPISSISHCQENGINLKNTVITHYNIMDRLSSDNKTSAWKSHQVCEGRQCPAANDELKTILDVTDNNLNLSETKPDADIGIGSFHANGYAENTGTSGMANGKENTHFLGHYDNNCSITEFNNEAERKSMRVLDQELAKNKLNHSCQGQKNSNQTNSQKKSIMLEINTPSTDIDGWSEQSLMSNHEPVNHSSGRSGGTGTSQPARNISNDCSSSKIHSQNSLVQDIQTGKSHIHVLNQENELSQAEATQQDLNNPVYYTSEIKQRKNIVRKNTMPLPSQANNLKPTLMYSQTVPIINLGFESSLKKISLSKEDQTKKRKSSFLAIQNMWKSSRLPREKQSKSLDGRTKRGSEIDFVLSLESMLPNRPTQGIRAMKWTKYRDNSPQDTQIARQVAKHVCNDHPGEILPAICSCKRKSNSLIGKKQPIRNIFLERR